MTTTWSSIDEAKKSVRGGHKRAFKNLKEPSGSRIARFIAPATMPTSKGDTIWIILAVTDEEILTGIAAMMGFMGGGTSTPRKYPHPVRSTPRTDGRYDVIVEGAADASMIMSAGDAIALESFLDPKQPAPLITPAVELVPGWYDDAQSPSLLRYYDGAQWTDRTAEKGQT